VDWLVRTVDLSDRDAILGVVRAAFTGDGRDGQEEIDIVMATWTVPAGRPGLELVAVAGDTVIGHLLAAAGDLNGRDVVAVAPLSVDPGYQRMGVGSALMTELVRHGDREEWPAVFLLGDPEYYRRFGFESSAPFGIVYGPAGEGSPYFQLRRLRAYDPSLRGEFRYCWEQPPFA
jgi:putative acetyltransferase